MLVLYTVTGFNVYKRSFAIAKTLNKINSMGVIIGIMSARDKQQPRSRSKGTRTQ